MKEHRHIEIVPGVMANMVPDASRETVNALCAMAKAARQSTTTKFHVLFWDGGWMNARGPFRDKDKAMSAAKRFALRFPHLTPITVRQEIISIATLAKIR